MNYGSRRCKVGLHKWSEWTDSQRANGEWYRWRVCTRCTEIGYFRGVTHE